MQIKSVLPRITHIFLMRRPRLQIKWLFYIKLSENNTLLIIPQWGIDGIHKNKIAYLHNTFQK